MRLAALDALPNETALIAHTQTSGRGQQGNTWTAEPNKNLTASILWYPNNLHANDSFVIAQMAALSVKYTLDTFATGFTVKWSNDILRNHQKIAGILIENTFCNQYVEKSVVGIGVNLNQNNFGSALPHAVSLMQITGQQTDPIHVLDSIRQHFHQLIELQQSGKLDTIRQQYAQCLYRKNGIHPYADASGNFMAKIIGIENSGEIILAKQDGTCKKYGFKEVQFIMDHD
jgi:BirA family biotin operon repressor/biotin-[acetyl-CoA-carboxylase] ligase